MSSNEEVSLSLLQIEPAGQSQHLQCSKPVLEDSLQNLRLPITWTTFTDMQVEGEIQAIEYDRSPTTSEGEEET